MRRLEEQYHGVQTFPLMTLQESNSSSYLYRNQANCAADASTAVSVPSHSTELHCSSWDWSASHLISSPGQSFLNLLRQLQSHEISNYSLSGLLHVRSSNQLSLSDSLTSSSHDWRTRQLHVSPRSRHNHLCLTHNQAVTLYGQSKNYVILALCAAGVSTFAVIWFWTDLISSS